eukprot:TRINITY_DN22508_c0_g1_i1.p1 TRINITY_DN22508_c0_g1~~TRINITY_DN22508_c0_g1_i1.p1  ORF type:complete len:208 (+),score=53.51 TRINITY_DN22508_c0_g1_i1:70-693(+)
MCIRDSDNTELLKKFNQHKAKADSESAQLNSEIANMKAKLESYEKNNDQLLVKVKEIEGYKHNSEVLSHKIKNLEEECKKAKEQQRSNLKLIDDYKGKLSAKDESLERHKEENDNLLNKIRILETGRKEEQASIKTQELEAKDKEIAKLQNKLHTLEAEHKKDKEQLQDKEELLGDYENEKNELLQKLTILEPVSYTHLTLPTICSV